MPHEPGSVPNQGAKALKEALGKREMSHGQLGRLVGVGADVVGRWVNGAHRPRADLAFKLKTELGIDPTAWWKDDPSPEPVEPAGKVA